jgi:hypothetical protein
VVVRARLHRDDRSAVAGDLTDDVHRLHRTHDEHLLAAGGCDPACNLRVVVESEPIRGIVGVCGRCERIDYTQIFVLLGSLLMLAALVLTRFDAAAHRRRLGALDRARVSL